MGFGEEITQLLLIIGALMLALGGVSMWSKRSGKGGEAGGGGGGAGSAGAAGGMGIGDLGDATGGGGSGLGEAVESRGGGSSDSRHGDRFKFTGKDAEVAAKVLKRMLKQDGDK